jgi:hypothetical protein
MKQTERKKRVLFTKEEDEIILNFVSVNGASRWERIEKIISTRTSRQCRERWKNFLSPSVQKGEWTNEEDALLESLVAQRGQKWSNFTEFFPGRTDVLIRNRYALLKRHFEKKRCSGQADKRMKKEVENEISPIIMKEVPQSAEENEYFEVEFEHPADFVDISLFDVEISSFFF